MWGKGEWRVKDEIKVVSLYDWEGGGGITVIRKWIQGVLYGEGEIIFSDAEFEMSMGNPTWDLKEETEDVLM